MDEKIVRELNLFWYAYNYRNASTEDADRAWKELEACVERLDAYVERIVDARLDYFLNED